MAKNISRTVKVYQYTMVKTERDDQGGISITDQKTFTSMEKLGLRKLAQYQKENPELAGYICGGVQEVFKVYSMSLEAFIQAAEVIEEVEG